MANETTIEIARRVRHTLASKALTAKQAKLYSQHLRLEMGSVGLLSLAPGYVDDYLDEAMLLLQCGLLERVADPTGGWRNGVKRAAEILEWLSQSNMRPSGSPLHLLAAAAYQLADYPAMALGHLRHVPEDQPFSILLREFLRANFPKTLQSVYRFWRDRHALMASNRIDPENLTNRSFQHVVMCIGAVCAYLRTGNDHMVNRALTKLDNLTASFLHSRDAYSYLLVQLTAASCRQFVETCLWPQIERLRENSTEETDAALIQFARSAFVNRRVLVWPAQTEGINKLVANSSFVLCTPTGSGKTTVATLAIVQGLFSQQSDNVRRPEVPGQGNMVLYIVPTRALAAEVEGRLAQDLKGITAEPIIVTGLYGGIDWGPTDAWIQTDRATIVICTFEKADALLRYIGILFLDRVRLVIIDEAHMVEQDRTRLADLKDGSSRAFRLEQIVARLLCARNEYSFRILALSAVANSAAPAMARWITGTPEAVPTRSSYRSTRQMLGRLEVSTAGQYVIRYDLMDGRSLKFDDEHRDNIPFVRDPFPQLPDGIDENLGPEVRMRAPTLWAALRLAAARPDGSTPSVLISLTQNIEPFSRTCADLMDNWPEDILPNYWAVDENSDLWVRCLASAADYFTEQSVEYRLLRRGIAVHHGKMPGLLARRLKILIDRGFVRVIIATSTLSEGVNIPVNYLLIPSVYRRQSVLSLQEFTNLVGRAGRPGVSTEGSALVVLPQRIMQRVRYGRRRPVYNRNWNGYEQLVTQIEEATTAAAEATQQDEASSPLAHLITALEEAWSELTGGTTRDEFITWLERTAVIDTDEEDSAAYNYLDSLDAFLIASIQEVEELRHSELEPDQVETELNAIWRRTYAFAATQEERRLSEIWLARGLVIKAQYPDAVQRRRIYKTSLSPRSATTLLSLAETIRTGFQRGADYALWPREQRFTFIVEILSLLSRVPSFRISTTLARNQNFRNWPNLLRWWLAKNTLSSQPTPKEITIWYDFISQNFIYRGAWGLGSIIGLLLEEADGVRPIRALEIGDWPRSGLPWIAFWIKELITWGTLEPVAAFLLARGDAIDRRQAESDAQAYYDSLQDNLSANDALDPRLIRYWMGARRGRPDVPAIVPEFDISAILERPQHQYRSMRLNVFPFEADGNLIWITPEGYQVARSQKPDMWPDDHMTLEFNLDVLTSRIIGNVYQRHA